jgi:hypothetical protein
MYQKSIHTARQTENNIAHKDKINQHINTRYNNFQTNTTKMIDSILNRHTDPVHFENIKTEDKVYTTAKEIKQQIQQHYET